MARRLPALLVVAAYSLGSPTWVAAQAATATLSGVVAPRIGGTYRLNDSAGHETALRGGWGIFYDIGSTSTMENLANSFPFTARRDLVNVPFPASADITAVPTVVPGSPVDFLTTADPNLRVPFTQQWNATIDQAIGSATSVTLSTWVRAATGFSARSDS